MPLVSAWGYRGGHGSKEEKDRGCIHSVGFGVQSVWDVSMGEREFQARERQGMGAGNNRFRFREHEVQGTGASGKWLMGLEGLLRH